MTYSFIEKAFEQLRVRFEVVLKLARELELEEELLPQLLPLTKSKEANLDFVPVFKAKLGLNQDLLPILKGSPTQFALSNHWQPLH